MAVSPPPAAADPSPDAASTAGHPLFSAQSEAKKQNQLIEIPSLRSETTTTYANPDGTTLHTELHTTPIRIRQDGRWRPIDTTLMEADGVIRPKAAKGDLTLSPGGDTAVLKTASDAGEVSVHAPRDLPRPELRGSTATYRSAYGKGLDMVVTATPTGFRQQVLIRQRPTGKLTLRFPVGLPQGLRYGKDTAGAPALLADGTKKIAPIAPALMLDAAALERPESGHSASAPATIDQATGTPVLTVTPDAGFLADPVVTYPVTLAVPAEDWTGTGIDGDTFVNNSTYPSGASNDSLDRILVGKSNSGSVTWRGYIRFNVKDTPLEGGEVVNSDLRLWNYRSNLCQSEIGFGIVARRVTSSWDMSTLTWSRQPAVTTTGQVGNKGAYTDDCSRGEGEMWYSIEQMVQDWMDGQPDYGVQLSSASESEATNWRWYRSLEYGNYESEDQPRGPVLIVNYIPATIKQDVVIPSLIDDPDSDEPLAYDSAVANRLEVAADTRLLAR
ncbi:DNRLRE domain-containing protein [Herbidospora cretacea]|uniref:DNRLRE domain-containing protein n=1 Tax=Herbidospora cretacea TaxID=28444 RepID=UPI000773D9A3|nr:DNRLRE domain-containing protein [Herbidospora cretacea]